MATGQLEIRWTTSSSASALRAAWLLADERPLVDPALVERLSPAAERLRDTLSVLPASAEQVWQHLLPLSAGIEGNRELAEVVLRKTCGAAAATAHRERLSAAIAVVEHAFRALLPNCADDLVLRARPLREQWEARGPGMLRRLAELTQPDILVDRAAVVLVQPMLGGYGETYLPYNAVHLEAVLANPVAELPEIVRLAWLLAQLHLDLPRFSERLTAARLPRIAGLALVPAILQAAQHVELVRLNEPLVERALQLWQKAGSDAAEVHTLYDWWTTYEHSRPSFAIALQALDRMIA